MNDPEVGDVWKYNRERAPTDYEILAVNHETGTITLKHLPEGYITSYELSRFRTIDKWELLKKRNLPKPGEIWRYTFMNDTRGHYEILAVRFDEERIAMIEMRKQGVNHVTHYPGAAWRAGDNWKLVATQEQASILKHMEKPPAQEQVVEEDQVIEI